MKRIPLKKLETQIHRASKRAFGEMLSAYPDEHYYVFALIANDALQSIHPLANTEEELDLTVERYVKTVDPKYGCTSTQHNMRWAHGDWGVQDVGLEQFDLVNQMLYDITLALDDVDDELACSCIDKMWSAAINGLASVHRDGFFGTGKKRREVTLLVVGDLPDDLVSRAAKACNPPSVRNRYLNWKY